jgi:hypothetical protein
MTFLGHSPDSRVPGFKLQTNCMESQIMDYFFLSTMGDAGCCKSMMKSCDHRRSRHAQLRSCAVLPARTDPTLHRSVIDLLWHCTETGRKPIFGIVIVLVGTANHHAVLHQYSIDSWNHPCRYAAGISVLFDCAVMLLRAV